MVSRNATYRASKGPGAFIPGGASISVLRRPSRLGYAVHQERSAAQFRQRVLARAGCPDAHESQVSKTEIVSVEIDEIPLSGRSAVCHHLAGPGRRSSWKD